MKERQWAKGIALRGVLACTTPRLTVFFGGVAHTDNFICKWEQLEQPLRDWYQRSAETLLGPVAWALRVGGGL
jgi:hypothetical protein